VCGSKIIADTSGHYTDEPLRSAQTIAPTSPSAELLVAPGRFEFELNGPPSLLIFSSERRGKTQSQQFIGAFLARLMQRAPDGIGLNPAPAVTEQLIAA
jgi:hypothetical protein